MNQSKKWVVSSWPAAKSKRRNGWKWKGKIWTWRAVETRNGFYVGAYKRGPPVGKGNWIQLGRCCLDWIGIGRPSRREGEIFPQFFSFFIYYYFSKMCGLNSTRTWLGLRAEEVASLSNLGPRTLHMFFLQSNTTLAKSLKIFQRLVGYYRRSIIIVCKLQ